MNETKISLSDIIAVLYHADNFVTSSKQLTSEDTDDKKEKKKRKQVTHVCFLY